MQPVARQCTSVLRFEEKAIVARLRCTCKYLQLILLVVLLGCIVRPSSPRGPVSEARSQLRSRCSSSISSSRTAPRTSTTQGSALRTEVSRPTRAVCVVSWTCHGPNLAALLGAESAEPLERCVDASWQEGGRAVQRPSTTHHLVQQVTGVAGARALGEHEGRVVLAAVSIVGANVPWAAGVHVGAVHAAARAVRAIGPDSITVATSRENATRLVARMLAVWPLGEQRRRPLLRCGPGQLEERQHVSSALKPRHANLGQFGRLRGGGRTCAVAPGCCRSVSMCRVHSSRVTQTLANRSTLLFTLGGPAYGWDSQRI